MDTLHLILNFRHPKPISGLKNVHVTLILSLKNGGIIEHLCSECQFYMNSPDLNNVPEGSLKC